MNAKEFRENQGVSIPEWNNIIDKMMEAYHKAKVEAISDEVSNEIKELELALEIDDLSEYGGGRLDAFKEVNELLKQK